MTLFSPDNPLKFVVNSLVSKMQEDARVHGEMRSLYNQNDELYAEILGFEASLLQAKTFMETIHIKRKIRHLKNKISSINEKIIQMSSFFTNRW